MGMGILLQTGIGTSHCDTKRFCSVAGGYCGADMTSIFAEATRKAASARFKQPQLDAEGQEIEVG